MLFSIPKLLFVVLAVDVTFCNALKVSCNAQCEADSSSEDCHVKEITRPPWSTNETTAPSPEWHVVQLYFYKTSSNMNGIALHISWSQKARIVKKFVDGYYLSISKLGSQQSSKFLFSLQDVKLFEDKEDIFFEFTCYGHDDNTEIKAGDSIFLTIHSLPMYQANTMNLGNEESIQIPDCFDHPKINLTEYCQRKIAEYDDFETYQENVDLPAPTISETKLFKLLLAAASVGAAIGLLVVFLALVAKVLHKKCKSSIKSKSYDAVKDTCNDSCLVLVSTSNDELDTLYCKAASILSDILKDQTQLEIMCNLWEHIGMHDPIEWTSKYSIKFKNVVLICTPLGKKNWENSQMNSGHCATIDPFVLNVNALLGQVKKVSVSIPVNQRFHVVYFDDDPSVCVPNQVLKVFDCFKLTEQLAQLFRQITGEAFTNSNPELCKLLQNITNNIQIYHNRQNIENTNLETVPLTGSHMLRNNDQFTSISLPNELNPQFDSGFSGTSTSYCDFHVSSCEGSQCSCQALSTSNFTNI